MTRDEIRGIIEGISDEQLKRILDINSSDIGKAKMQAEELGNKLKETEEKLSQTETVLEDLRQSQCEADEMREEMTRLQKVIDEYKAQEERTAKNTEMSERFRAATNQAKFVNELTEKALFESFVAEVGKEENSGKSDAEVISNIVDGKENLFAAEESVPAVVASTMGYKGVLSDGDVREIMGLPAK